MIEYLGLDNRPLDHDLCKCAKCGNEQYEKPSRPGDKYAWMCRYCSTANEGGKVHLLQGQAWFHEPGCFYDP